MSQPGYFDRLLSSAVNTWWVRLWPVAGAALLAIVVYFFAGLIIAPSIQTLYRFNLNEFFPLTHFNDGRQYVYICTQGYTFQSDMTLSRWSFARIDWLPVYAVLQCGIHAAGISLVVAGWLVSMLAFGLSVAFAVLILRQMHIPSAGWIALTLFLPVIGGAWLFLAGAEATFFAVGMIVLWLITLPSAHTAWGDLGRAAIGATVGVIFALTKANALAMLLPLLFAFFYQSWQRSRGVGYTHRFDVFVADVLIEHLQPIWVVLRWFGRRIHRELFRIEARPIVYEWTALAVSVGIGLGFSYWLWFSSSLSGIPFFFLQTQAQVTASWTPGNALAMLTYFAQTLQLFQNWPGSIPTATIVATWYLAINLSPLIPAASRRVPPLIRVMLVLTTIFVLYSGAVRDSDRYIPSTALVAIGWACWVAPSSERVAIAGAARTAYRRMWLRVGFLFAMFIITSLLLLDGLLPLRY